MTTPRELAHALEVQATMPDAPNAAGLRIAATVALLDRIDDLQPLLDDRPVVAFAKEHFPRCPGRLPGGCLPM